MFFIFDFFFLISISFVSNICFRFFFFLLFLCASDFKLENSKSLIDKNLILKIHKINSWRSSSDGSANPAGNIHNSNIGSGGSGTSNNNSNRHKSGDERLFQYMEADGSDPEDYTR